MSQHDILNPTPLHPLNPDYSFQKKRPITHLNTKANRGRPYFRDLTDVGHQFVLSWADKSKEDADRLKWYYEQYQGGVFTFIDHEGGGRHYVGHFSSPVEPAPASHGHWFVQQIQFDEIPGLAMLQYPDRWDRDAIWALLIDDFGDGPMAAVNGTWTLATNAAAKSGSVISSPNTNTTDRAAYQYRGYGFQFWAPTGPAMGIAQILLDGVVLGNVDFYSAVASTQAVNLFTQLNVPLGVHVVQINATNTKDSSSTGKTIQWDALRVMR